MRTIVTADGEVLKDNDDGVFKPHVEIQGNLVTVRAYKSDAKPPTKKKGQVISQFSKQARMRLLKRIAIVKWEKLPNGIFVTLTYPDSVPKMDLRSCTIHRSRFIRDLEREVGYELSVLWKKEWRPRQTGTRVDSWLPHFHCSIFGPRFVHHSVIRSVWRKCLGVDGALCTDVEAIRNGMHAAFYLAKYLSKDGWDCSLDYVPYLNNPGRAWGWTRWRSVPTNEPRYLTNLSIEVMHEIYLQARRLRSVKDEWACPSISLLGNRAKNMERLIEGIVD